MFCRIRCRRQALNLLGVQRTLWGLTGRQNILSLCFIKPDVEPPKCLPQTQLFWRSSWFLPMLARHHDSPTLALSRLLHCYRESWEANSGPALIRPWQARSPFRWQQPVLFPRPAHVSSPVLSPQVCGKAVLPFSFCSLACLLAFFQGI